MNKSALKSFATEARLELLEKIQLQARKLGITPDAIQQASLESSDAIFIDGKPLSNVEREQRNKLIKRVNEIGYDRVMEEAAYTWFNRFIALRYMEVNDYLPTKVRVLSSVNPDSTEPDMFKEVLNLDLPIDKELVYNLKIENKTDELFKYLIKIHCNDLNRYMPFMFETIEGYMEVLFPEGLLGTDTFVRQLINTELISEDDWGKIEIIGWLYQYYIADQKDRVFKAKAKYKAEEIPYATQLFTPDWIVQYMVQNSLGRCWTEAHPEHEDLIEKWDFFLKHQQEDFKEKIAPYVKKNLNVEEIKCFDPAMGSGHILVYMFDILYEIYSKCGYMEREIPRLIIEKNLYGLDIDDRAYQLASFSVVMKALQHNSRFLRSIERDGLMMNLASINETNGWTDEAITYVAGEENGETFNSVKAFFEQFINAKMFGSLIRVTESDTAFLENRLKQIKENPVADIFQEDTRERALKQLPMLIKQTKVMGQQYDTVVMNPPYMGSGSMGKELSDFLKENYPDSKSDLFSAFMEVEHYLKKNGFYAAINQHSWMFLSSFEKLREKIINNKFIDTMLHLGPRAFEAIGGEVVQSTAFVLRNSIIEDLKGIYIRLVNEKNATEKKEKTIFAVNNPKLSYYEFNQMSFEKVPGGPIVYWASDNLLKDFEVGSSMNELIEPKVGLQTGENNQFLRFWWELNPSKIKFDTVSTEESKTNGFKWVPYNKGGERRQWYGNYDYVVNWENDGEEIRNFKNEKGKLRSVVRNPQYYFKEAITWSDITSGGFSIRYRSKGSIHDVSGMSAFTNDTRKMKYLLGLMATKISNYIFKMLNPTIHLQIGDFSNFPVLYEEQVVNKVIQLVDNNLNIAKAEWDSFEISWEFTAHPFLSNKKATVEEAFNDWKVRSSQEFIQLKQNEEELNQIFIDIYDLQEDLSPNLEEEEITIRKAVLDRDIKSFISYAIGCSFGRYSLNEEGLINAGGEFNASRYKTFQVDEDNILPVLPSAYFKDDIVTKFIDFIRITFSDETLEENLDFIADAIGHKKTETAREVIRRYFINDFFKDHVQIYKKRPIYWLFTSGKEKAFNCLIYIHRYDKTTLSRIRTDYVHEVQNRMDAERTDLLNIINGDSNVKEIAAAKKELKSLEKKIDELKKYDELLHHMADQQIEIDLDNGVKHNYELFKGLVAKI